MWQLDSQENAQVFQVYVAQRLWDLTTYYSASVGKQAKMLGTQGPARSGPLLQTWPSGGTGGGNLQVPGILREAQRASADV